MNGDLGRKYRKRTAFEEPSYWQSYSDMMAALLLIFILIIAITLAIYKQKTTDLEQTQIELNAAKQKLEVATEEQNARLIWTITAARSKRPNMIWRIPCSNFSRPMMRRP